MDAGKVIHGVTAGTVTALGAVAAIVSYRHGYEVVTAHGEPPATALLVPLCADGLVLIASMMMLSAAYRAERPHWLVKTALVMGILATLAVNILHGIAYGVVGAVIAGWPAAALIIAVELLMLSVRQAASRSAVPAKTTADLSTAQQHSNSRPAAQQDAYTPISTAEAAVDSAPPQVRKSPAATVAVDTRGTAARLPAQQYNTPAAALAAGVPKSAVQQQFSISRYAVDKLVKQQQTAPKLQVVGRSDS